MPGSHTHAPRLNDKPAATQNAQVSIRLDKRSLSTGDVGQKSESQLEALEHSVQAAANANTSSKLITASPAPMPELVRNDLANEDSLLRALDVQTLQEAKVSTSCPSPTLSKILLGIYSLVVDCRHSAASDPPPPGGEFRLCTTTAQIR